MLKLRIDGDDAVRLGEVELLDYRHEFDIRDAVVVRVLRFRDRVGRVTTLRSRRFVSMADVHHAGLEWTLEPENWSGQVEVVSAIDGRVVNSGVPRYGQLEGRHVAGVGPRTFGPEVVALKVETRQSNVYVSEAARTRVFAVTCGSTSDRSLYQMEDYVQQVLTFDVRQGSAVRVEKLVTFFTSRDPATSDTLVKAGRSALRYVDFDEALERHRSAWHDVWAAATSIFPVTSGSSSCCGCTSAMCSRCVHATPPTSTPECRARAQRRGVSGSRVLGRALRLSVPELPDAGDDPGAAHVPVPAPRGGACLGPRSGAPGRDVPVAERQ